MLHVQSESRNNTGVKTTQGSTLYLIVIQQRPHRPLRLGAFHLGLNLLRHPWSRYSGTPPNLGDRFVHYLSQQVNRATIRLRVAAVEQRIARKVEWLCNFGKEFVRVRASGLALRAGDTI